MTPIIGRKQEPKKIINENMRKAQKLWNSPKLWKSNEYKMLLKLIEKTQEIAETVEVDEEDIVHLWSMKGSVYGMGYHNFYEASYCYDQALAINPRDIFTLINRVAVLKKMEKWDELIENCDMALEIIRQDRDKELRTIDRSIEPLKTWEQVLSHLKATIGYAWCSKGISLNSQGNSEEAIECFDRALKKNARDPEAGLGKALALNKLKKFREAIPYLDTALDIFPEYDQAWFAKGMVLGNLGKIKEMDPAIAFKEAIECYDRTLKINPKHYQAWVNKGWALSNLGKTEEAIECYDKALKINSRDSRALLAWRNKGLALGNLGKFREAIKCYDRALKIYPKYVQAWYDKGEALKNIGKHKEAEECFHKVAEIDPSASSRARI